MFPSCIAPNKMLLSMSADVNRPGEVPEVVVQDEGHRHKRRLTHKQKRNQKHAVSKARQ